MSISVEHGPALRRAGGNYQPDVVLSLMEEPELALVGAPINVLAEELSRPTQ